jgi:hypothetical protein
MLYLSIFSTVLVIRPGGKDWKALKSRLAIIHGFGKSRRGEAYWQPLGGSVNYSSGQ